MSEQVALFPDFEKIVVAKTKTPPIHLHESLESLALLYTSGESGKCSGIRFMMTVEDAKKWCSLPISHGVLSGSHWAYFWTSVKNFLQRDLTYEKMPTEIDISNCNDDGSWDAKIANAGCKKISLNDFVGVLTPLGITVKGRPNMTRIEVLE